MSERTFTTVEAKQSDGTSVGVVTSSEYNGWANHETWNVALWLQNTESYYLAMVEFMKDYKGTQPYVDFLESCGLDTQETHDGVRYVSEELNYKELNDMMLEFSPEGTRA